MMKALQSAEPSVDVGLPMGPSSKSDDIEDDDDDFDDDDFSEIYRSTIGGI